MGQPAEVLTHLLDRTHEGPLLGEGVAFGPLGEEQRAVIHRQTAEIAATTASRLTFTLDSALPDASLEEISTHVRQVVPKTTAFFGALTAGELSSDEHTRLLSLIGLAGTGMYVADQLTDRGDKAMRHAIDSYNGLRIFPEEKVAELVPHRMDIMTTMGQAIKEFAGADAPDVQICYSSLVLLNEVRLQRISHHYFGAQPEGRNHYMDALAIPIAEMMVADAGYQSVTSSLHTLYKKENDELPSIQILHSDPRVQQLLQIANTAARIGDERSDFYMDAGNDPQYGEGSINPFNQPHPKLTATFCRLAGITNPTEMGMIHRRFIGFANTEDPHERNEHGAFVTDIFFNQLRAGIAEAEDTWPAEFRQYLTCIKRVGEISVVNMEEGDIKMGGGTMPA